MPTTPPRWAGKKDWDDWTQRVTQWSRDVERAKQWLHEIYENRETIKL
jgi:hypothetical protein